MKTCPRCGFSNLDTDNFCTRCGQPLPPSPPEPEKPKKKLGLVLGIIIGVIIVGLLAAIIVVLIQGRKAGTESEEKSRESVEEQAEESSDEVSEVPDSSTQSAATENTSSTEPAESAETAESSEQAESSEAAESSQAEDSDLQPSSAELPRVSSLTRPSLMSGATQINNPALVPSVPEYSVAADFSNITNTEVYSFNDEMIQHIVQDGFIVTDGYEKEFFSVYQSNKWLYRANFITVDSMMHTYHLYFAYLMKNTEKNYLSSTLLTLSEKMLAKSLAQYDQLKGTEWEQAARTNVAFFAVGTCLQNPVTVIPADVVDIVTAELALIQEAGTMTKSPLTGIDEDYTQYKPRGYYEGDEQLESYFRTMMWYGRLNFKQKEEDLDRSALLMTLALDAETLPIWESIYSVTSFFAGASDDAGYYEYKPLIDAAYGENTTVESLPGATHSWGIFHSLTKDLEPPKVNSVPTYVDPDTDLLAENLGFRFMGQRFTLDAAIFQNLIYNKVQETESNERRMLPDTLDVMAAMGSDTALSLLQTQGAFEYPGYLENMQMLRDEIAAAGDEQWNASLYSSWLYTLNPLLKTKGAGYPYFMQTELWARKDLESYAGSFTELKHDTVLYTKQPMGGRGDGGDIPTADDRGYVQPEPEIFSRLAVLTEKTATGLKSFGMLSAEDEANLLRLSELAKQLMTISEKELINETLTDEEYELIRSFGTDLQYFWYETIKEDAAELGDMPLSNLLDLFPAALIVDIATNPEGSCLEVATGNPSVIYVACLVDGDVKICSGTVYNWYQFEQPLSDRMTDTAWRQLMGISPMEDGSYNRETEGRPDKPAWTLDYRRE